MKNFISIVLVFFTSSALAQITKKSDLSGFKVQWTCPQESYKNVSQLPVSSEITVSVDENGDIKYQPDIFETEPKTKNFFQKINPFRAKNKSYQVSYDDCLDRFYSTINKAHKEYKISCPQSEKLCEYESRFLTLKSKKTVEESVYFQNESNVIILPRILPGSTQVTVKHVEANELLKRFCTKDKVTDSTILFSKNIIENVVKMSQGSSSEIACSKKYKKALDQEVSRIKNESCKDNSKNPICGVVTENLKNTNFVEEPTKITAQSVSNEKTELEKSVDDYLKNKFQIPVINCGFTNYEKVGRLNMVDLSNFDEEISSNLENIFSHGSSNCQKVFLQNYIVSKEESLARNGDQSKACKNKNSKECKTILAREATIEKNIKGMIKIIYGDLGERYLREKVACLNESDKTLEDILSKLKDSQKVISCMDTKEGDYLQVANRMNFDFPPGDYTIKNLGDNKFRAYLNIEFRDNSSLKTTASEVMNRTQKCLADITPFLKGPNGEKLEIKIVNKDNGLDDLPKQERPNLTSIGLSGNGSRSNSTRYEESIDCPTIAHEVMHLFGLCDEYQETSGPGGDNYSCRTVPQAVSLMKTQKDMFDLAVDKSYSCDCSGALCKKIMTSNDEEKKNFYLSKSAFEVISYQDRTSYCSFSSLPSSSYSKLASKRSLLNLSNSQGNQNLTKLEIESRTFDYGSDDIVTRTQFSCKCTPGDKKCSAFLKSTLELVNNSDDYAGMGCPTGSKLITSGIGDSGSTAKATYNKADHSLKITSKARVPSLLHPSHFQKILGGACVEKSQKYIECAKLAYMSGDCNVPEYCKDDSSFLGIKQ